MNNENKMEILAKEVIRFLQEWGLWEGTGILTNGMRFEYTDDHQKNYKGICNVEFIKNVDPKDYMTGLIASADPEECNKKMCLANPEHLFDMTYEGPLYMLLRLDEYEVRKADIGEKAWDYIFEHTDILDEFLYEKYECLNAEDLLNVIKEYFFDDPEHNDWDPLVFDTWEDYQKFVNGEAYPDGEEKKIPNYLRYGTYHDYLTIYEKTEEMTVKDVEPLWRTMVRKAKKEFTEDFGEDGNMKINIPGIAGYVYSQFRDIFSRYGLWYEFEFGWSLSCYEQCVKDYVMFIVKSSIRPDFNMNYTHDLIEAWGMTDDGEVICFADDHAVWDYVRSSERESSEDWSKYRSQYDHWIPGVRFESLWTDVWVRPDHTKLYESFSRRGRSKKRVMELMSSVLTHSFRN